MGVSANVRNIQILAELKAALARFKDEAQSSLNSAQQEIQRAVEWLAERENYWQGEVRRREQMVDQARAALKRCQASGSYDREGHYSPPNCNAEEAVLAQTQRQHSEARTELRTVQQSSQKLNQTVADFQREARRLSRMLENDVTKASALLESKIAILQGYLGDAAPSVFAIPPAASVSPASALPKPLTWSQQRAIWQLVDAGQPITKEELQSLQQLPSDLQTETRTEDESWIQQILESERYREAMRNSQEAEELTKNLSALLATLKAINYWRSKP